MRGFKTPPPAPPAPAPPGARRAWLEGRAETSMRGGRAGEPEREDTRTRTDAVTEGHGDMRGGLARDAGTERCTRDDREAETQRETVM